jgi:hypothetical protein
MLEEEEMLGSYETAKQRLAFTFISLGSKPKPLLFTDTISQAWNNILLDLQLP